MGSSKKPRKKYKPKFLPGQTPVVFAAPKEKTDQIALERHLSLVALRTGTAEDEHAWGIAAHLRIGAQLCTLEADVVKKAIACGLEGIYQVIKRGEEKGRYVATGTELTAITDALTIADELQQASTRREVRDAMLKVWAEED